KVALRVLRLVDAVMRDPFDGIGKPEPLRAIGSGVWSRRITQDYPEQGVRIPYQEYLRNGHAADDIICRVPRNALLPFSYGGEHVSDDVAVAILERVLQCVERVRADGHVAGDWERRLAWLNDALAEAWSGRGPFPGAGAGAYGSDGLGRGATPVQ
ncbi:MAG: type II toxin-antitoxin system YoeB family toxin, partial [Acidobacteria bacterium]|nr:type II toxin-antitoxin system YoeB family toxin [Acidobacteriota bacterium]